MRPTRKHKTFSASMRRRTRLVNSTFTDRSPTPHQVRINMQRMRRCPEPVETWQVYVGVWKDASPAEAARALLDGRAVRLGEEY